MSTEQPGRTSRQNNAGSPMGSTIAIVVTIVAVILGFFILKQIRDDDGGDTKPADTSAATTLPGSVTTLEAAPTTTGFVLVFEGTVVQVANASNQNGVAGQLTTALTGLGFTTVDATNSTAKLELSEVYYVASIPEAKAVAESVAYAMGKIPVKVAPTPVPTAEAVLPDGVGVLVMLGNDKAGKTLAQMSGAAGPSDSVAPPAVVTATT